MRERLTRNHYRARVFRYTDPDGRLRARFSLYVNGESLSGHEAEDGLGPDFDLPADAVEDLLLDLVTYPISGDLSEYDSTPLTAHQRTTETALLAGEALVLLSELLVEARDASRTLAGLLRAYPLPPDLVDRLHGRWHWLRPE